MRTRLLLVMVLIVVLVGAAWPVGSAEASNCTWHTVKRGENLYQISRAYGVTVSAITAANGIKNANRIYVGQRLCIPQSGTVSPPPTCHTIHVVQRGEYLKIIASKYGTTVAAIVQANRLKNPNFVYVGQRLKIPTKCLIPAPKPTTQPTGTWKAVYWKNRDQAGDPAFTRYVDNVHFDWGTGGPAGLPSDNFSIRFTRTMHFEAGKYLFHVLVDDGVRLFIDKELEIDQWRVQPPTNFSVEKNLAAGNHTLRVDYFENLGGAQIKLQIEALEVPVPKPVAKWYAEYFSNRNLQGTPVATDTVSQIHFEMGKGSPKTGVPADDFSARWTGEFDFAAGQYRFYATVDDGVRIYLDGNPILEKWFDQSRTTHWVDVDVSEGKHKVKVEYYEHKGDAVAKVWWVKR
jgi:LysM repeat protein